MRTTAELALQLLPGTRRLALINGSSPWERAHRMRALLKRGEPLQERHSLNDLVREVARLLANDMQMQVRTASPGPGLVELSVQDSGAGIEPARLARIFEPFYSTKEHGLGMGLSISRSIVEAHGGRLQAENPPGQGALLRCVLPAAHPESSS